MIEPTIDRRLSPQRPVRLYSWDDVLSLLIIATLREQKISVQYIRQIVQHVRGRGFSMAQVEFAIGGSRVHFGPQEVSGRMPIGRSPSFGESWISSPSRLGFAAQPNAAGTMLARPNCGAAQWARSYWWREPVSRCPRWSVS